MNDSMFIENDPIFVSARIPWEIYKFCGGLDLITAKYLSLCKDCGEKINIGDNIYFSDESGGWAHYDCK